MIHIDPETGKVTDPVRDLTGRDPPLSVPRQVSETPQSPQPQTTDFTEICPMDVDPGYILRVKLDSGASIVIASELSKQEAERRELVIHQAMIEFRTKRNAWEKEMDKNDKR